MTEPGAFRHLFRAPKYVIAGVHLLPLPGSPAYDRAAGMRPIRERAREEARVLADHGADALLFTNEADVPYVQRLAPETVAAFADVAAGATRDLRLPFGINALLDAVSGVAIAHATGAAFVRGYLAGAYVTDVGVVDTRAPETLRLRASLGGAPVFLLHNLVCAFGAALGERPMGEEARGAKVNSGADGFTIAGRAAGTPPDPALCAEVRRAVPDMPLVVGAGVSLDNVGALLDAADGVLVVSCLREDGRTLGRIDRARVERFMGLVRQRPDARA